MAQNGLLPVTYQRHGHRYWRRITSYDFARSIPDCPVVEAEIFEVAAAFPIAFKSTGNGIEPVAVLSMNPAKPTPFVSADGAWRAAYIPSLLRCLPFHADRVEGSDHENKNQFRLLVDEATGLVTDDASDEAFFDADGGLMPALKNIRAFFQARIAASEETRRLCRIIHKLGLFTPLAQHQTVAFSPGFLGIDKNKLEGLSQSQSMMMASNGALRLVHAHQISLSHAAWLTQAQKEIARPLSRTCSDSASATSEFLMAIANSQDSENMFAKHRPESTHAGA